MGLKYHLFRLYERLEGRDFSPFYAAFKRNEFEDLNTLRKTQFDKLKKLVSHAHQTVPYYRDLFHSIGFNPSDLNGLEDLKKIPTLSKNTLKENFDALVSSRYDRSHLMEYATGGSTGTPSRFLMTREQYDARAAVSFKAYQMTGWDFLKKTILLSGAPIEYARYEKSKMKIKSFLLRQKAISTFDLTEEKLHKIYRLIQRERPGVLFGYVSALLMFAGYLESRNLKVEVPVIVQMAELIDPDQIAYLERFLGGKFYRHYGARDAIAMGIECEERTGLHVNMDTLVIEIIRKNEEVTDGHGEVVVTDLYSHAMPLIRYKIGDVGIWKRGICPCGRAAPLFEITLGRTSNIITTRNGTMMTGLFIPHLFKERSSEIKKYQIHQPDVDNLVISIVKRAGYTTRDERYLEGKLREKLGHEIAMNFVYPDDISSEASGKYLFVKSDVAVDFGND